MKLYKILLAGALFLGMFACNKPELQTPLDPPEYDMTGFAKGADISWVTEMEKAGVKFYNANGKQTELMQLLRGYGMNSIRLRVWVNPSAGWSSKEDVLLKAFRASQLGFRIMIDFHYSDSWADPSQQTKPTAWEDLAFDALKDSVASHTSEVLNLLKENNIDVEWVQVGNETGNGILWDDGNASTNMAQYAQLNNAGYDAVKEVYPNAKVVVHLQEGNKNSLFRWLFDGLKNNGGQWDVIGMSLYPSTDDWETLTTDLIANANDMIDRYGSEVMVCETGMDWSAADTAYNFLSTLIEECKAIENDMCLGVLYWEPQSYNSWNNYEMGAFDENGKPTKAMDAFLE